MSYVPNHSFGHESGPRDSVRAQTQPEWILRPPGTFSNPSRPPVSPSPAPNPNKIVKNQTNKQMGEKSGNSSPLRSAPIRPFKGPNRSCPNTWPYNRQPTRPLSPNSASSPNSHRLRSPPAHPRHEPPQLHLRPPPWEGVAGVTAPSAWVPVLPQHPPVVGDLLI